MKEIQLLNLLELLIKEAFAIRSEEAKYYEAEFAHYLMKAIQNRKVGSNDQ